MSMAPQEDKAEAYDKICNYIIIQYYRGLTVGKLSVSLCVRWWRRNAEKEFRNQNTKKEYKERMQRTIVSMELKKIYIKIKAHRFQLIYNGIEFYLELTMFVNKGRFGVRLWRSQTSGHSGIGIQRSQTFRFWESCLEVPDVWILRILSRGARRLGTLGLGSTFGF